MTTPLAGDNPALVSGVFVINPSQAEQKGYAPLGFSVDTTGMGLHAWAFPSPDVLCSLRGPPGGTLAFCVHPVPNSPQDPGALEDLLRRHHYSPAPTAIGPPVHIPLAGAPRLARAFITGESHARALWVAIAVADPGGARHGLLVVAGAGPYPRPEVDHSILLAHPDLRRLCDTFRPVAQAGQPAALARPAPQAAWWKSRPLLGCLGAIVIFALAAAALTAAVLGSGHSSILTVDNASDVSVRVSINGVPVADLAPRRWMDLTREAGPMSIVVAGPNGVIDQSSFELSSHAFRDTRTVYNIAGLAHYAVVKVRYRLANDPLPPAPPTITPFGEGLRFFELPDGSRSTCPSQGRSCRSSTASSISAMSRARPEWRRVADPDRASSRNVFRGIHEKQL